MTATEAERQLRNNVGAMRQDRSLLNTFPFNQENHDPAAHHGDHHAVHAEHNEASQSLPAINSAQGDAGVSFSEVAAAKEVAGKRCIDKVEMVEHTETDEVVQCDHSYDKRCHTTYVTNYESQQEEECDENYRKNCFIEYEQKAITETVQICRTPLVKDCDVVGDEICRTEYESECWTKQEEHDVSSIRCL